MKTKIVIGTTTAFALLFLLVPTAFASVMDVIKSVAKGDSTLWIGLATLVLLYIFKRIPNDKIQLVIGKFAYGVGVTITLGLSKWKLTAPLWNKTIEPYLVDLLDNIVGTFVSKFIEGLHSDKDKNA